MINKTMAESLIYAYKFLSKKCEMIDDFVDDYAISMSHIDTFSMSEKIIESIQRKKRLINLKIYLDRCLSYMSEKNRKILLLIAYYDFGVEKFSKIFNKSERMVYRYINSAYLELSVKLKENSSQIDLKNILKKEKWICDLSNTYINSRVISKTVDIDDKKMII